MPIKVANMSKFVQSMMGYDASSLNDNHGQDENKENTPPKEIHLPIVKAKVLRKVIEFCDYYQNVEPMKEIEKPLTKNSIEEAVQPWYSDFVTLEEQPMLHEIILAAAALDIKPLLDLSVASMIMGKTVSYAHTIRFFRHVLFSYCLTTLLKTKT